VGKKIKSQRDDHDDLDELEDDEEQDQDEQGSDDEDDDEQGSDGENDDDEQDDDAGFEGEFDAKRARNTIGRLRRELKKAKDAKSAPKGSAELTKVQQENLRLRVALKAGLDDDLADRLRGGTEEELLEDAQKLLDRFYPADGEKKKLETRQPKARLKGGSKPNEDPELDAEDIVKKALGR